MGYHRAGFRVVGVDKEPQPNYPFEFIQADVRDLDVDFISSFDARHASPPCQSFTAYRRRGDGVGDSYLNLIPETRDLLSASEAPWVIENVQGAASQMRAPIMLCGSSFHLDVRRHRLFESNVDLRPLACDHSWQTPRFAQATNRANLRSTVEIGVWRIPLEVQKRAMGIDWMELRELSESIPPAYTEFIGRQLIEHLAVTA